jgi:hypothetical protein
MIPPSERIALIARCPEVARVFDELDEASGELDDTRRAALVEIAKLRAALEMVWNRWSFHGQNHTHTWHDRADCAGIVKAALEGR